jgi:Rrf2 family protein
VGANCRFAVAVHVLAVLAYKEGEAVTSTLLAQSVNTNPVVIRRILLLLQDASLIITRKGAGLGSKLRRPPAEINLADVYRAVETADTFTLNASQPNRACPVGSSIQMALHRIFKAAEQAMENELRQSTLADVVQWVKQSETPRRRK